jgi:hypothetical protein
MGAVGLVEDRENTAALASVWTLRWGWVVFDPPPVGNDSSAFQRYGKRWAVARKRRSSVSSSSLLASISSATGTGEVASMQ